MKLQKLLIGGIIAVVSLIAGNRLFRGPLVTSEFQVHGVKAGPIEDEITARRVAAAYFERVDGLCGSFSLAREMSDEWIFSMSIGYYGRSDADIIVKRDGTEICQGIWQPVVKFSGGQWIFIQRSSR